MLRNLVSFRNTKLSLRRSIWSYAKVQGLTSLLIRNRRFQLGKRHVAWEYVNVGCGPYPVEGFCNIDYGWRPGVFCFDIRKGIPPHRQCERHLHRALSRVSDYGAMSFRAARFP